MGGGATEGGRAGASAPSRSDSGRGPSGKNPPRRAGGTPLKVACIGGAHLDYGGLVRGRAVLGSSNPGTVHHDFGGVARNVAVNLACLGCSVSLVSRVGDDEAGRRVREHAELAGIDTSNVSLSEVHPTA